MTPPYSRNREALTKPKLRVLERMFAKEVNDALAKNAGELSGLYQSGAKIMDDLLADELVYFHTVTLPGRFPVTVTGFLLTHAGRAAYCSTCEMP